MMIPGSLVSPLLSPLSLPRFFSRLAYNPLLVGEASGWQATGVDLVPLHGGLGHRFAPV